MTRITRIPANFTGLLLCAFTLPAQVTGVHSTGEEYGKKP